MNYPNGKTEIVSFKVKCLGDCVLSVLKEEGDAVVLGVTSKGLFLQNQSQQVCFVSQDVFNGPITINLHDKVNFKALTEVGDLCVILKDRIVFTDFQFVIHQRSSIFSPPPIQFNMEDISPAIERSVDFVTTLIGEYEDGVFSPFLRKIVADYPQVEKEELLALIPNMGDGFKRFEWLTGLLGYGRGLTPSGDDFICGFLLAKHYLNPFLPVTVEYDAYVDELKTLAAQKTTALSATLIACASLGKADERIMHTLDWIASGNGELLKIKEELLSYGSSSGIDTFAGMLVALLML